MIQVFIRKKFLRYMTEVTTGCLVLSKFKLNNDVFYTKSIINNNLGNILIRKLNRKLIKYESNT